MAKFNQPDTNMTVNRSGFPAYKMKKKTHLVTAALTTMFGEPKYYADNDIVRLATHLCESDPAFVCKLACYARNVGNMRSVSHVLTCVIAHHAREYTRRTIRNVVVRPDDITEIMACYKHMYGKPYPNAMKREIADVIQRFDEYQLARYNGGSGALKLRDVLRITHPTPKTKEIDALLGKILNDTLPTPYTWETELSARGNTTKVWNELIASGQVGYMALLRNLRNIVKSGADVTPVLKILSDPERVRRSRQLPFRFYSAYRTLYLENMLSPEIHRALESALTVSIDNMEQFKGRTLIAVDISDSMGWFISKKSNVCCGDIAALLGAMASCLCEDATVCYFHSGPDINSGLKIAHYSKSDSIPDICRKTAFYGGGTDMTLPLRWALEEDETVDLKPFDRIIYFSDNQCSHSLKGITRSADRGKTQNNPAVKGRVFLYIFEFFAYSSVRASASSLATPQSRSACA